MASFTPNYNLEKPVEGEKYYISKFNANADKVDTALKTQADTISTNKTQEEQDISELRTEVKEYTDTQLSDHNLSETAHSFIQQKITDSLTEAKTYAKDYADTKTTPNDVADAIAQHNMSEDAHQDIRDEIRNMGANTQTMIDNSISLHNISDEAHADIRESVENISNRIDDAINAHNTDPTAHGAMLEMTAISSDNYETGTINKSWDEILNAYNTIRNVTLKLGNYDVKITSHNYIEEEFYGSYFDGFDEHRVVIYKDSNNIPSFINNSIWAISPFVDYASADISYLRT